MRLIALTALASTRVGKEISYAEIAQEIQVADAEVESWVIQSQFSHPCSVPFSFLSFSSLSGIRSDTRYPFRFFVLSHPRQTRSGQAEPADANVCRHQIDHPGIHGG